MNYTTVEKVKKYLNVTVEDAYTPQIEQWVTAMSMFIDTYCNRVIAREEATTRTFKGNGGNVLIIDECNGINTVSLAGYTALPRNREYVQALQYERNVAEEVSVNAVFAMATEAPEPIQFATTVLVAGIVNTTRSGGDNIATEKIGGQYQVTYRNASERADFKQAMTILDGYKRVTF